MEQEAEGAAREGGRDANKVDGERDFQRRLSARAVAAVRKPSPESPAATLCPGHQFGQCVATTCLLLGLLVSSPAAAEVFKCSSHGHVAYQDTPCPDEATSRRLVVAANGNLDVASPPAPSKPRPAAPMPPALDMGAFKPPASMSLPDIYKQLRTLGARERELDKGMEKETGAIRADYRASVKRLKTRDGIMKEWASDTRRRAQRSRALGDEGGRRIREFTRELRAVTAKPMPAGGGEQAREAMREREEALARINQKWRPQIADNQREVEAAEREMQQRNRAFEKRVDSYDRKREIRALGERYRAEVISARDRWLPRIRRIGERRDALVQEIRRRCPHGAALSPGRQQCRK